MYGGDMTTALLRRSFFHFSALIPTSVLRRPLVRVKRPLEESQPKKK
jgi:hypothetical protein